ncbi:NAD(P)H-dependent oxidoreductase [Fluviispira sanaruensis]|uniref:NAD(P)H-dependent oxidoreductase n=1 Tax=Fluviispira sanaruensis TaxID=2493639 RepID=A0A4P2VQ50_FLUSA|nr:NAD(P)H-dependent oxidoreductase [Fluviispira sanaruensis]BBH54460.1 NAD(P)H-dependent oxidoreductase [Fluviispira sanaruensis]
MEFLEALSLRHACKVFDESRTVSEEDKRLIVEFGRQSPSSFGIEPWHFLVISDKNLRERLKPACWNQAQITTSSFIVVYLSYLPYHFRGDTPFLKQRLWRRSQDNERYKIMLDKVTDFLAAQDTQEWAKRQVYIPLANMLTGATTLRIDSCPIEGFDSEKLKPLLVEYINWNTFDLVAISAFGYRINEQPKKIREEVSSVITYIN